MNDFRKQNFLAHQNEAKILLIGDSLIANLLLFPNIWKDYFSNYKVLNFGVSGDKTQNCLWRTENLNFPKDVTDVYLLCGVNNIDSDQPLDIVKGIISCGLSVKRKQSSTNIHIIGLLPRDSANSPRRSKIDQVNEILLNDCWTNNLLFLPNPKRDW